MLIMPYEKVHRIESGKFLVSREESAAGYKDPRRIHSPVLYRGDPGGSSDDDGTEVELARRAGDSDCPRSGIARARFPGDENNRKERKRAQ